MLFPPSPLRLKNSFVWASQLGGAALVLAGVAAASGYAWWNWGNVEELLDQSRIWKEGVPALSSEVEGRVTSHKFIFNAYDLDVGFVDGNHVAHHQKLKFDTLVTTVDKTSEPTVRYLQSAPDHFALSWAIDVTASRWAANIFMVVAGVGLIGGSFFFLGVLILRRLIDARRCARRCDEVVVHLTKIVEQRNKGAHTGNEYHFTGKTEDGREVSGKVSFPIKHEPLYADRSKQTLLALVSPENLKRPVVPRADFHPFDLDLDDRIRILKAIEARG